jgi:hypothetical protein
MRLGKYPCSLTAGTIAREVYGKELIFERHRHRYEFNNRYREILKKNGLVISGICEDRDLVEMVELKDHPWFVGCQFHPEFKSKPMAPHPLFTHFVSAALHQSLGKKKRVSPATAFKKMKAELVTQVKRAKATKASKVEKSNRRKSVAKSETSKVSTARKKAKEFFLA